MPAEPCRTVARHLTVEIVGGKDTQARPAALTGIVRLGADLELVRDSPTVGIDTFDDTGAA